MLRGRQLLQVLGTEGVRKNIREDAWILAAGAKIATFEKVVLSDVRFGNEAGLVWALGGHVWRIERPDNAGTTLDHPSESEQDENRCRQAPPE